MLCPEVINFPPPKTICYSNRNDNLNSVVDRINMNSFYKSLVITCPDEINTPESIEEILTDDWEYYELTDCSLLEFIEPTFIESFVKKGRLYCLSTNKNCIVDNCVAVTPDGVLTLHVLEFIFQTLGFEGTKRPHNYYEVRIDLKNLKRFDKVKFGLSKLEQFAFYVMWEPHEENICPSSIAKYFYDRGVSIKTHPLVLKNVSPDITEIPSIKDTESDEMVEWIGMLAHEANIDEPELYISTYCQPDSEMALKSTRISLVIVKGFLTPTLVTALCKALLEHAISRPLENYWTAISIQSQEDSLWQWAPSSPKMFQAHDSSYNVFFSRDCVVSYSLGQLKYS